MIAREGRRGFSDLKAGDGVRTLWPFHDSRKDCVSGTWHLLPVGKSSLNLHALHTAVFGDGNLRGFSVTDLNT